jgi:competence ComEA-like helix-hairpin-helix protein
MGDADRSGPVGACALLIIVVTMAWSAVLTGRPVVVANGTHEGYLSDRIELRLDPNVATAGELAAIVGLGEKHAQDIVAYRTEFEATHHGETAFANMSDLTAAKGIGPKTAEVALPFLRFPPSAGEVADAVVIKRKNKN